MYNQQELHLHKATAVKRIRDWHMATHVGATLTAQLKLVEESLEEFKQDKLASKLAKFFIASAAVGTWLPIISAILLDDAMMLANQVGLSPTELLEVVSNRMSEIKEEHQITYPTEEE